MCEVGFEQGRGDGRGKKPLLFSIFTHIYIYGGAMASGASTRCTRIYAEKTIQLAHKHGFTEPTKLSTEHDDLCERADGRHGCDTLALGRESST